jgi:putative FmdB family regulatory protein
MPTYDYNCDACDHEFEVFESITADPQKKCPKCKKKKLRRLFGAGGGLIFKGSGFYQTDYRGESYKKAAEADKPKTESATSSSDSSTKAETPKTETKSDGHSKSETKPQKHKN